MRSSGVPTQVVLDTLVARFVLVRCRLFFQGVSPSEAGGVHGGKRGGAQDVPQKGVHGSDISYYRRVKCTSPLSHLCFYLPFGLVLGHLR